jgi:predicted RNA binding protein YcfA (HicA-like mRNA interferase family)
MSPRLPALTAKQVLAALQRAGFFIHHSHGSHYYLKHPAKPTLRVTIPYHSRVLKRGTLQSIIKQAGLTTEEFLKLL